MNFPERPARMLRRAIALLGATLLAVGSTTAAAAPASAAEVGYVRLGHLSPDTPAVDVYLAESAHPEQPQIFKAVPYGTLSRYLSLPAGAYAVAMRKAGAPASEPPVLTTEVLVAAGKAYTVAGVGRYADLGLRVLDDDLSAPARGQAKVRVVQASVREPVIDVAAPGGPTIASGVQFATTTSYAQVQPGSWKLRLQSAGTAPTMVDAALTAGTVYSLLVLDREQGGLTTELRVDARGGEVVPLGGVETGAGGTAGRHGLPYPLIAIAAGLLAALVAGAAVLVVRRRGRSTW